MDISFYCDKCGLHLLVPEEGKGMGAKCPTCGAELIVPMESAPKRERPAPAALTTPKKHSWPLAAVTVGLLLAAGVFFYVVKHNSRDQETDQLSQTSLERSKASVELNQRLARTEELRAQAQAQLASAHEQIQELTRASTQLSDDKSAIEKRLAHTEELKSQTEAELETLRVARQTLEASVGQLRATVEELEKRLTQAEQRRAGAEADLLKATNKIAELQTANENLRAKEAPQP